MKKLTALLRKLRLRQILTVLLAGVLLLVSTACNSGGGDMRGARPDNPTVQAGGMNNPHKEGGDRNTNFNMSPDPQVNTAKPTSERQRASQQPISKQVIAAAIGGDTSTTDSQPGGSGLLYQGSEPLKTETFNRQLGGDESLLEDVGEMPAQRQPVFDRSDPNAKLLERAGAVFQDASAFLKDRPGNAPEKSHS